MRTVWSERNPAKRCSIMDAESLIISLEKYGPLGLFLAAFMSNLIPGFPAIYLTLVGAYGALVHDPGTHIAVILSAGVGAGLGKIVVFYTSYFLAGKSQTIRKKREEYLWVLRTGRLGKLGIFLLVLLFASLPLPDDVLYIPLGISGFSGLWFAAGVIIGKILLTIMVFALGNAYWGLVERYFGDAENVNWGLVIGGLAAGTLLLTWILLSINWRRIYEEFSHSGFKKATIAFLDELIGVLTLRSLRKRLSK